MNTSTFPTREEAENLLVWAGESNPGPWTDHSKVTARAAECIAKECGLDSHRAYVSGLLHDIGRYEGVRGVHHIYAGYELMMQKGYREIAEICLSHSFPYQIFEAYGGGAIDCNDEELSVIRSFLSEKVYNDYDKLIQLCDALCIAEGVCIMEVRMINVIRRYGFTEHTQQKLNTVFSIKEHFDKLCGKNIYDLFYDEIREISFV